MTTARPFFFAFVALSVGVLTAVAAHWPEPNLAILTLLVLVTVTASILAMSRFARIDGTVPRLATPLLFGLMLLFFWEVLTTALEVPRVILPPPSLIAVAIAHNLYFLGTDFFQTFVKEVVPGLLLGSLIGFLAALAIDRSPFLQRGLMPLASLASAVPIVGIAPIMIMWFGFDWPSKVAVIVVMTFFPMLVNTCAGLAEAGTIEQELMRTYAASYGQTLWKLRLPGAMPFVFNALKLNSTLALIGAIVAEFFGVPTLGIGFRISTEVGRMEIDVVWATTAMAAVVGSLSYGAIVLIERRITFWHPSFRS